jgi:hypothetical protein
VSRTTTPALSLPGVEWLSGAQGNRLAPQPHDVRPSIGRTQRTGIPFADDLVTAGSETELQVAVLGRKDQVDLPLSIEASRYYANLLKRSNTRDTPKRALRELQKYLSDNAANVWENSWVRFSRDRLTPAAQRLLDRDMRTSRKDPRSDRRSDASRFHVPGEDGAARLRVPVSYLINLALADFLASDDRLASPLVNWCSGLQKHLISDNVSPETCSFYVSTIRSGEHGGKRLARETGERFLLTHLLVAYANQRFGLVESGQRAVVHFAPHTPLGQRHLNECISDTFYRELFTSPCLSGWDRGEEKHAYMRLCHEVLSRSQLYAAAKVRDAGLIATDLLMLPTFSSTSLSNNGIHVSLGSERLAEIAETDGPAEEKRLGDLVTKIVEHFLPLFVGAYSASPYRFDFADFHAERVLGFLPHELDFTHLRMLWRRWKGKASVNVLWRALSPTGYSAVDRFLAFVFRLRGDLVPDARLLDYLVAPLSTDESPALDGTLGNVERLKHDLAMMGVYDERLSFYALYRQRVASKAGYAGFEARYYSLCHSLLDDLGPATDLQRFVTAWAFRRAMDGSLTHDDIPDDPITESERRQVVFGAAIGVPTFFVRAGTRNKLLLSLIAGTEGTRSSGRYSGYVRIKQPQYRLALLNALRGEAELVEMLGMRETLEDLELRLRDPERHSAAGKLTRGVLDQLGARSAMNVNAREFNQAAEQYYREELRRRYLREAFGSTTGAMHQDAGLESAFTRATDDEATLPELQELLRHTLSVIHERSQECSPVGAG